MAALTISAPIVARAGSFAGRKVATKATNGTGKTAMRATWMPGSEPPSYLDGSLPWCVTPHLTPILLLYHALAALFESFFSHGGTNDWMVILSIVGRDSPRDVWGIRRSGEETER